jgi:hypothetical protein
VLSTFFTITFNKEKLKSKSEKTTPGKARMAQWYRVSLVFLMDV